MKESGHYTIYVGGFYNYGEKHSSFPRAAAILWSLEMDTAINNPRKVYTVSPTKWSRVYISKNRREEKNSRKRIWI